LIRGRGRFYKEGLALLLNAPQSRVSRVNPRHPSMQGRQSQREAKPPHIPIGSFRGTKSLFLIPSPSPLKERGIKGVR